MSVLHLFAWGPADGPPVLMVHGVTNTGRRFRELAEEHLAGLRVLAPDLRGHGLSTWDPPWGAERHVADLLETLDRAGVQRPVVVGHSFGGMLGLHLAATAPERVAALVLLDPAVALDPARAGAEAEAARTDEGWAGVEEARAARLSLRPPQSRHTVEEDLATFLREGPDGRWRLNFSRPAAVSAWGEMARPAPDLTRFRGQVDLVVAQRADYVTEALRTSLHRDLGPRLAETVVDAGHALYWDAPDAVARVVRRAVAA
jgi:lipase